ncbi:MAG: UpxY family transcription antiterminator [Rikenellaceae bacterium]
MNYIVVNDTLDTVWYAMKASYGKAKEAKGELDEMMIESFITIHYKKEKVNGRNQMVPKVAIPNLIFVRTDRNHLEAAKSKIDYLHNMLTKSDDRNDVLMPIIVPDDDMQRFMTVIADAQEKVKFVDVDLNRQIISAGTRVRVIDGKYEGYEGILCRPKGSRSRKVLIDICGLAPVEMPIIDIELLEEI